MAIAPFHMRKVMYLPQIAHENLEIYSSKTQ